MSDYERFKKLLEYFVTHLSYVTGTIDENDVNVKLLIPSIEKNNFKASGQGYNDQKIQNQISDWEDYLYGKICINIYGADPRSKGTYLNWKSTGHNIRALWNDKGDIERLALTYYDYADTKDWSDFGKISILDLGLLDGSPPNAKLKSFFDDYCKMHKPQLFNMKNIQDLLESHRNIILTGAPGTGKTFTAQDIAAQMIGCFDKDDKEKQSEALSKSEQYKLVQFHPAYTYEDFVRGIVAKASDDGISYEVENKTLAEFAKTALENYEDSKKEIELLSKEQWVNKQFNDFLNSVQVQLDSGRYPMGDDSRYLIEIKDEEEMFYYQQGGNMGVKRNMSFEDIKRAYIDNTLDSNAIRSNHNLSPTARNRGLVTYYVFMVERFVTYLKENNLSYTQNAEISKVKLKNYILVIDEINRANLPAVLGELIYALEYRGRAIDTMYENPNSKEGQKDKTLTIPENLFIIGTMNTADRSAGQVDYAIRRRFAFVPVLPKELTSADLPSGKTFETDLFRQVSELFVDKYTGAETDIDTPSAYLSSEFKPEDVWIGHSYFITDDTKKTGKKRLQYEIKPLLREYLKDGILQNTKEVENIINGLESKLK